MQKTEIGTTNVTVESWLDVHMYSKPLTNKVIESSWKYPESIVERVTFDYYMGFLIVEGTDKEFSPFTEYIPIDDIASLKIMRFDKKTVTSVTGFEEDGVTPKTSTQVIGPYAVNAAGDMVRVVGIRDPKR